MTAVLDTDLEQIATAIWGTLFDLPLEPTDVTSSEGGSMVTSVIHIDGAWHGAVLLRCPMALAVVLTTAMFLSEGQPDHDDVRDALGELANMVAGNVKALLPEPCGISLPAVALGPDYELSVVGASPVATASFTYADHPLVITLLHGGPEGSRV